MSNKQSALINFYKGLLEKFGSDPETKSIIKSHLSELKKNKITVRDLDSIESSIKSYKSSNRSIISSSHYSPSDLKSTQKTPHSTLSPLKDLSPESIHQNRSTSFRPSKKPAKGPLDHSIFPSESSSNSLVSDEIWRLYSSISPSDYKKGLDVWGQIHKADYLKYLKEVENHSRLKKNNQKVYKEILDQQLKDSIQYKDMKSLQCSLILPSELKGNSDNEAWKRELEQNIERNIERNKKLRMNENEQDLKVIEKWKLDQKLEKQNLLEKRKRYKVLAHELINTSLEKRYDNYDKFVKSRARSRELMTQRLDSLEKSKIQHTAETLQRLNWVHNDQRLKKLLPAPLTPTPDPLSTSLPIGTPDYNKSKKLRENQQDLLFQMKLKQKSLESQKQELLKEAKLSHIQQQKNIQDYKISVMQKKNTEQILRQELDKQIANKAKKQLDELLFTDHEAKINKRIFESSLELLNQHK